MPQWSKEVKMCKTAKVPHISYWIQIICQMKFRRIIDNVQILDLGLYACYRTALFSNLLHQIDHMYFIFGLLSSILATSSLKSNHCGLGFFCPLIGTDRSRAGEAALNSAWMLRVQYGERILASQHFFLKRFRPPAFRYCLRKRHMYTIVQSWFLNAIFVNESPFKKTFFMFLFVDKWASLLAFSSMSL